MYHFSIFQLYMYARVYVRMIDGTNLLLLFKRSKVSTVEIHLDSVDNRPEKKAMLWKNEVRLHSKMTKVRGSKL